MLRLQLYVPETNRLCYNCPFSKKNVDFDYKTGGFLKRPILPLYDSKIKGNVFVYYFGKSIYLIFLAIYNYYILRSVYIIFSTNENILANLLLLMSEFLLGNYFIFLIWVYARTFLPLERAPGYIGTQIHDGTGRGVHFQSVKDRLPFVSVLIPVYHEHFPVVRKTILGALDLIYPPEKLDVNIIDDSPEDDTLKTFCDAMGVNYFSRQNRKGYKAGAINFALKRLKGDLVLFLDADHIPEPRIILNCLNSWRNNTVGVQARIDFVNMVDFLTIMGTYLHLIFYSLSQRSRRATGTALFAGGTALMDRRILLKEGGINELTIAEDTDTSILLEMRGYRIEFIDHVGSWALVPWDPLSLVRQVWRWMTGLTRSLRARAISIIKSPLPIFSKIDFLYAEFLPTLGVYAWFTTFLLAYLALVDGSIHRYNQVISVFGYSISIFTTLLSILGTVPAFVGILSLMVDSPFLIYVRRGTIFRVKNTFLFFMISIIGQPLMIFAVIKGWLGTNVSFNRTPKKKKTNEPEIPRLKRMYSFGTFTLFLIGIVFFYTAINVGTTSPFFIPFFYGFYSSSFPLVIALLWYWKLEPYLDKVKEISADMIIEEHTAYS